ncbi:MAG: N-acetylmuramate alpha-1-phosphate uridylyltransferase MurU [Gammaproteobacteria bacterium]
MKAMILAAGRGARLSPLTDTTPKPLLIVGGKTLLDWQLDKLQVAGFRQVIINLGYLGEKIRRHMEINPRPHISIEFSVEPQSAYETGGGIVHALPMLGEDPFAVVNADVYSDFDFARLHQIPSANDNANWRGHLVLVANPLHHPNGDFGLQTGRVTTKADRMFTYSGIAVLHPKLFSGLAHGRFPLAPILSQAIAQDALSGELHRGFWSDIGTKERLREINEIKLAIEDETEI